MSLRVIGGEYRGRSLRPVKGMMTRPLLGQAREAIFNILGPRVEGATVWDLFAGTGATGIEALSRGAAHVVFVEKARQAIDVLRDNLRMLGDSATSRARVLRGDAWDPVVEPGEAALDDPDLIFLDPPYALVAEDPSRTVFRAHALVRRLRPGGVLCFHFERGVLDVDDFDIPVDLRRYGRCSIAFLRRAEDAPAVRTESDESFEGGEGASDGEGDRERADLGLDEEFQSDEADD
ncbi:MAG: RsmD family RNA methyltransferase [Planctomycetota bacterium]